MLLRGGRAPRRLSYDSGPSRAEHPARTSNCYISALIYPCTLGMTDALIIDRDEVDVALRLLNQPLHCVRVEARKYLTVSGTWQRYSTTYEVLARVQCHPTSSKVVRSTRSRRSVFHGRIARSTIFPSGVLHRFAELPRQ
jgi:hypothetical protein